MIEISHRQAQRLIRQRIDGPIPDEQWAILQAHLEGCEECRAYQAGMQGSERSLRRVLRLRWSPVHGPRQTLEKTVKSSRTRRKEMRKLVNYLALASVILFLGVLYASYRRATAPPPTPTPNLAAIRNTATPSPARNTFRGVTAYVAEERGSPEIFLLNPGSGDDDSELVNMTNDPAADTDPAWSPDGEWLAFLSDRTGKSEVYVMHVSGSRLTQLSGEPGVLWHGPLSWSPDGAWIALTGTPIHETASDDAQNEDAWVYLVPVGNAERGAGPRKLGLTRGTAGRVRFSPDDMLLAYPTGGQSDRGIMLYDLERGSFIAITQADQQVDLLRTGANDGFDWSDDGRLAYIAEGPVDPQTGELLSDAGVQVRTTLSPAQFGGGVYDSSSNQLIESLPGAGAIRQVAYVPGREGRGQTVAYLLDEDADDCWTVTLHLALERDTRPRTIPGLCVDGAFSRENFTRDGHWLVVNGHLPDEAETAMYAVRIPIDLTRTTDDVIERLAGEASPQSDPPSAAPVIRPTGALLGIAPRAVPEAAAELPPAAFPPGRRGQVIYSLIQQGTGFPLVAILPDGSGARTLPSGARPGEDHYICPAFSPDGQQIAFLSDRESGREGLYEVFVMDADGQNTRRAARNIFSRGANQAGSFECPIWSPDGSRLASVLRSDGGDQLAVIPLAEDAAVTFLPVSATSVITLPVWSPDGTQLLLAYHRDRQTPPRITAVNLGDAEGDSPTVRTLIESDGWGDVTGIAYSPNGEQIAFVVAYYRANANLPTQFQLRLMGPDGENPSSLGQLPESRMRGTLRGSALDWGSDNRLSFMSRGAMHDREKSNFYLLDLSLPDAVGITSVAALDEVVFDYTWSPDRRWLMLAAESGLVAISVDGTIAGETSPGRISGEWVYEVDWR